MDKKTRWFVEPFDDFTNQVVATIAESRDFDCGSYKCADDETHDLWEVNRHIINVLKNSRYHLKLVIWNKKGGGKIREWTFESKKKQKSAFAR